MFTESFDVTSSLGGRFKIGRNGSSKIARQISLPAAVAGVVTSGSTSRVLTLGANHGITSAMLVAVFWSGGQRLDMTVTAYDATTITVTAASGVGTAFPANTTVITVCPATSRNDIAFAAAGLQMISMGCDPISGVTFSVAANLLDGGSASLLAPVAIGGECYSWAYGTGPANPITGTVASVNCYNGATQAVVLNFGVLLT
jgi:hypothetical protein